MKTSSHNLLVSLLRVLVREWGYKEVDLALREAASTDTDAMESRVSRWTTVATRRPKKAKPSATDLVAHASVEDSRKRALIEIATRFDKKDFLPSLSDVRELLISMGRRPGAMKDRSDAFRQLLVALVNISPEGLDRLLGSARHSGPAQLGPLSDAISGFANRKRFGDG